MNVDHKKEILFYYQSIRANPNGDPGFEDQPRLMSDNTILVTDLRLKRTIRDHARDTLKQKLFVDYNEEDQPAAAREKARELLDKKKLPPETIELLLGETFDTNLFGAFIPNPETGRASGEATWYRLTGPVQFGLGKSVNEVEIINPTISAHFIGRPTDSGKDPHATLGKLWAVDYALIKFQGGINPVNLGKYNKENKTPQSFDDAEKILLDCIWDGTNGLHTKSKFRQNSVFYFEVTYKKKIYNDLPDLIDDSPMKGHKTELVKEPFKTKILEEALIKRKDEIVRIRMRCSEPLTKQVNALCKKLCNKKIDAKIV